MVLIQNKIFPWFCIQWLLLLLPPSGPWTVYAEMSHLHAQNFKKAKICRFAKSCNFLLDFQSIIRLSVNWESLRHIEDALIVCRCCVADLWSTSIDLKSVDRNAGVLIKHLVIKRISSCSPSSWHIYAPYLYVKKILEILSSLSIFTL